MIQRELEFRYWDEHLKKMSPANACLYPCPGVTYMQFINMLDKNKQKMFEGDIVINTSHDEEYCSPAVVGFSMYEEVGWALYMPNSHLQEFQRPLIQKEFNGMALAEEFPISRFGCYEVIGNIYENRELMTNGELDEYWIQRWEESQGEWLL